MNNKSKEYKKHNSFINFKSSPDNDSLNFNKYIKDILNDKSKIENLNDKEKKIIEKLKNDFKLDKTDDDKIFRITPHVKEEILKIENKDILNYLIHRYRYEIFPLENIIDNYPPYLQIEPSSICNYRCVFCFETDKTFTNKKNGFMGAMDLNLFKKIVDQAEKNIEFISIASRGEPLVNKNIDKMLEYTEGKFLNLKLNTNASLLNEKYIHAILSGGVKTVVFSADAAEEKLYAKLRVNGELKKVVKNIELFNKIREKSYSKNKIISRVSGVKFNDEQNIDSMENFWKKMVDQVAFVDYNPWENIYEKDPSDISKPCSDLWRRMFIWWDGKVNPCDSDYKSELQVGNIKDKSISELWNSQKYNEYRKSHISKNRKNLYPCKNCIVT
jgi:radical SAM protein with 4Fe4S-binding SPASM domain